MLDELGRKVAETNANGEMVQFAYKPAGDLLTLTDRKGQGTTWGYDEYGRVTNKVDDAENEVFRCTQPAKNNQVHGTVNRGHQPGSVPQIRMFWLDLPSGRS